MVFLREPFKTWPLLTTHAQDSECFHSNIKKLRIKSIHNFPLYISMLRFAALVYSSTYQSATI